MSPACLKWKGWLHGPIESCAFESETLPTIAALKFGESNGQFFGGPLRIPSFYIPVSDGSCGNLSIPATGHHSRRPGRQGRLNHLLLGLES